MSTSYLIQTGDGQNFLFDVGTGSIVNLYATNVALANITKVTGFIVLRTSSAMWYAHEAGRFACCRAELQQYLNLNAGLSVTSSQRPHYRPSASVCNRKRPASPIASMGPQWSYRRYRNKRHRARPQSSKSCLICSISVNPPLLKRRGASTVIGVLAVLGMGPGVPQSCQRIPSRLRWQPNRCQRVPV